MWSDKIVIAGEDHRVELVSLLKEKNKGNRCYHNRKGMQACKAPGAEDMNYLQAQSWDFS